MGVRYLGMEVSSHALAQERVDAVRFDTAVFTNLTRDHLDFHRTMDAYALAKARLFSFPDARASRHQHGRCHGSSHRTEPALIAARDGNLVWRRRVPRRLRFSSCRRAACARRSAGLEVEFDSSWGSGPLRSRSDRRVQRRESHRDARGAAALGRCLWRGGARARSGQRRRPGRMETFRGGPGQPRRCRRLRSFARLSRARHCAPRASIVADACGACSAAVAIAIPASDP